MNPYFIGPASLFFRHLTAQTGQLLNLSNKSDISQTLGVNLPPILTSRPEPPYSQAIKESGYPPANTP